MGLSTSEGVTRIRALLPDGTYRTNRIYGSGYMRPIGLGVTSVRVVVRAQTPSHRYAHRPSYLLSPKLFTDSLITAY